MQSADWDYLGCVSVIDRFELVLRFFWTVRTSKKPHSRKHPPFRRLEVSQKKVIFNYTFSFAENSLVSQPLCSNLYLIAFLFQFTLGTLRTPLTDNRTEMFWLQARLFEDKIYTKLIKCLRAMLTSQSTFGTSLFNIDENAMHDRKDVVKNVNCTI